MISWRLIRLLKPKFCNKRKEALKCRLPKGVSNFETRRIGLLTQILGLRLKMALSYQDTRLWPTTSLRKIE